MFAITTKKSAVRFAATMACTAALGLSTLTGCGGKKMMTPDQKMEAMKMAPGDIIDTATGPNMEDVTTVVSLIKQAGLVDTLRGQGPFTVFAPTNEAFKALGQDKCDELMRPENKEKLKAILLYHVHIGPAVFSGDASTMDLPTAAGKPLHVSVSGDDVMVNDAKVVKADIVCKNGVIHWIDKVVMPTN